MNPAASEGMNRDKEFSNRALLLNGNSKSLVWLRAWVESESSKSGKFRNGLVEQQHQIEEIITTYIQPLDLHTFLLPLPA